VRDLDKHPNNRKHERRKTNKQNKNTRYKNDNNIFLFSFQLFSLTGRASGTQVTAVTLFICTAVLAMQQANPENTK